MRGAAAAGVEAGPVAAESTRRWKMRPGSLAWPPGRFSRRQALQSESSGGSSLVRLKPPWQGLLAFCVPGSGVGGLLADRSAGSTY